jgi:3'-phosphoadenosine 5'-phosphosulfate (PAPS) 3'-phosphatase
MTVDISAFLVAAALAARQVGVVARRLQGQVANEGKDVGDVAGLSDFHKRQAQAKTAVDEIAQDIIITALAPYLPRDNTVLDGEEETPGKALLPSKTGEYVLVLDPIDGTLIYLDGGNTYSVNIGLFKDGGIVAALLYYPALDVAYWTDAKTVWRAEQFTLRGMQGAIPIKAAVQPQNPKSTFVYFALDEKTKQVLSASGLDFRRSFQNDFGADPMLGMFNGVVAAAVLEHIQVRDLIHGAILTCAGGYIQDWQGQPLKWPQHGGALPKCVVSAWPLQPELQAVLRAHAA